MDVRVWNGTADKVKTSASSWLDEAVKFWENKPYESTDGVQELRADRLGLFLMQFLL